MSRLRMPWFEEAWIPGGPDWAALWSMAEKKDGLFTNADARSCGVRRSLLSHHARRGGLERVRRGVYRLRWPPPGPYHRIRAEWMAAGLDRAVASHESALFLWELLDEEPHHVHLTLPRERRGKIPSPEIACARRVCYHAPRHAVAEHEIALRHGIRVTTADRAILDTARNPVETEEVAEAVRRAVRSGLIHADRLLVEARRRGGSARCLVERGVAVVAPRGAV